MMKTQLSDFWWFGLKRTDPCWMPHHYVCPLLMTVSAWLYRLRGKDARWYPGRRGEAPSGPPYDTGWITSATVCIGNYEARCLFPRWAIVLECHYRNYGFRRLFWQEVLVTPVRRWWLRRRALAAGAGD